MGKIINSKQLINGKTKYFIQTNLREALSLQGNFKNIILFSTQFCTHKTRIIKTGVKSSSKYFEIPQSLLLKKNLKRKRNSLPEELSISCQKMETKKQYIFIYTIPKGSIF